MKAKDLTKLTQKELEKRLLEKRNELEELEFDIKVGQETNYALRKKQRQELAKIMTVLNSGVFAVEDKKTLEKTRKVRKTTVKRATRDSKTGPKSDKITKPTSKRKNSK